MSEEGAATSGSEELVRKILSRYLQNEGRYDRWGAQGKLIVALEVFHEEGLNVRNGFLERLVNSVFPRTFLPDLGTTINPVLVPRLESYYREKSVEFWSQEIEPGLTVEETAIRFHVTPATVRDILQNRYPPAGSSARENKSNE